MRPFSEATRHSITHPGLLLREVSGFEEGNKKGNSVLATVEKNMQQSFQKAETGSVLAEDTVVSVKQIIIFDLSQNSKN